MTRVKNFDFKKVWNEIRLSKILKFVRRGRVTEEEVEVSIASTESRSFTAKFPHSARRLLEASLS